MSNNPEAAKWFDLSLRPVAIGSLPHTNVSEACELIASTLPEIPFWPQLPKLSYLESMYVQYSEKFPGIVIEKERERIYVDRSGSPDFDAALERLYIAYLENDIDQYGMSQEYATGLHHVLANGAGTPRAIKGHITGPISFGLTVTDQNRRAILYDETLADALAKFLRLKVAWQEKMLKAICPRTIMFIDEPYMSAFGSAFVSVSREQVIGYLTEVMNGISGLKGVHCCGNTDWSVLLSTPLDILNFDAYSFTESLTLYPLEVRAFLERGGILAWGIVPNDAEKLDVETGDSLVERLNLGMDLLARKGIDRELIMSRALVTPACGLGSCSVEVAARALSLLAEVSAKMRIGR
ncbi:MAG: methionine synthase [Dehalococcoidia bacterium]|nr:methionine synthase [Dehalococcoidia bacterium]